jgi:hypothetical protein
MKPLRWIGSVRWKGLVDDFWAWKTHKMPEDVTFLPACNVNVGMDT